MAEHVSPEVGDDPLAEGGDEIKPRSRGEREHSGDGDQAEKIGIDQAGAFRRKAEIDHPPDRQRHRQGRRRRHRHGGKGTKNARFIAQKIRRKLQQCARGRLLLGSVGVRREGGGFAHRSIIAMIFSAGARKFLLIRE